MIYSLRNNCTENYYNRMLTVQVIIKTQSHKFLKKQMSVKVYRCFYNWAQ